jgi:hypothetical protein
MVTEDGDGRRRRLLEAVVTTVIRRLSLWFSGVAARNDGRVGGQWQRKEKKKKKNKICIGEKEEFAMAVVPLVRI